MSFTPADRASSIHIYDRRPFVVALDNDAAGERGWLKARNETVDWTGFNLSSTSRNIRIETRPHCGGSAAAHSEIEELRFSQTVKDDPHSRVLDAYFWCFVDYGDAPQTTPLFAKIHEGEELAVVIARQFDLSPHEAESAIEISPEGGRCQGKAPWLGVQNIVSHRPYRGISSLLLDSTEFQSPFWLTSKPT